MKRRLASLAALLVLAAGPVLAGQNMVGNIKVEQAWARATPGKTPNGAAYLIISAEGGEADRLVAAASPVARKAALHTHLTEEGVMKMRPLKAVEIVPGSPTVFQPGGHHIMLMGLTAPLMAGETFPLTLTFERAGPIEILVTVEKIGATGPTMESQGGDGHGS